MEFSRELRDDVLAGDITLTVRLWQRPQVKEGGRYRVGPGAVEVDVVELVPYAVLAHAVGELQARRLLLGRSPGAQRARRLQGLARADGPLPHRGAHVDAEDELALRVGVREVGDAVRPDALGELHQLVLVAD